MKEHLITFFGLSPLIHGGGYETYIIKMAEKLYENGYKINIVTGNQYINDIICLLVFHRRMEKRLSKEKIFDKLNIKMYEFGFDSIIPTGKSFKFIKNIMENSNIIYTRNEFYDFLFINHFCRDHCPPIVCGIHTSIYYPYTKSFTSRIHNLLYGKLFYSRLLNYCSIILPQNDFDTKLIQAYKLNDTKITKLLPFVDNRFFHRIDVNRENKNFKILFTGRLTEQKGIDTFCRFIENLSHTSEFKECEITVNGSGELDYLIYDLIKKYDNINYLGFVSNEKLVDLYNSHDVVILPSRWETALKVVLEAQSCGLPVIVSNIPGPDELILPGKTGFLVEPDNDIDIGEKVMKLFKLKKYDYQKYLKMRSDSILNSEKYNIDIISRKLEDIFIKLID